MAKSIAVVIEVVIVTSANDGTRAKTTEAATIVDDGRAWSKAMEAAVKFAAAEASTSKATAVKTATAEAAAVATTATAVATAAASATCQRHGRGG